jgi:hypothetical protein
VSTYSTAIWTRHGDGASVEYVLLGIGFYRRIAIQKWSPHFHEETVERGVRIGGRRFGTSKTLKRFYKDPQS